MTRRLLAMFAVLALATSACGSDDDNPEVSAATTTPDAVTTTTAPTQSATAKPNATTTTTAHDGTPPGLVPADSATPTAGTCANSANGIAEIVLNPDVPSPRCMMVASTDHLRVENNFAFEVTVDDGGGSFSVKPGASYTVMKAFGGYFATGVHRLKVSNAASKAALYGGSGPEIWLK